MAEAGLSLGSNLGDKAAAIEVALQLLDETPGIHVLHRSRLYRTEPWGDADQDWFLNACAIVETTLSPRALLDTCLALETTLGRDRAQSRRWGPRNIDIDLLFYDDLELAEPGLILPHPRMFERAFVLVPLSEIAADRVVAGRRIGEAARTIGANGVELWDRWG
jgi:2-amino-4-hydroxy-6-hydroxymethyldihydropteridine diphosphokinase